MAQYGELVSIDSQLIINYPDFSIKLIGKRSIQTLRYQLEYYDFQISTPSTVKTLSYTNGIGEICPHRFIVEGVEYGLIIQNGLLIDHFKKIKDFCYSPKKK